jgi:hypothetical protein
MQISMGPTRVLVAVLVRRYSFVPILALEIDAAGLRALGAPGAAREGRVRLAGRAPLAW